MSFKNNPYLYRLKPTISMTQIPEKKSIKDWAEDDRPREKMLNKGKSALSDAELIAILIGSGTPNCSAVELARDILNSAGNNLVSLSNLTLKDLMQHKGIGEAKAISIAAALELGKRRRGADALKKRTVASSMEAYEHFLLHIDDTCKEHFLVLFLDQANHPLKIEHISDGGITCTVADPKIIYKKALELNATGIILCHNHPSGNPLPSQEDKKLTKKICEAGNLLDIKVMDHIIIGEERYYSFRDHDEMPL